MEMSRNITCDSTGERHGSWLSDCFSADPEWATNISKVGCSHLGDDGCARRDCRESKHRRVLVLNVWRGEVERRQEKKVKSLSAKTLSGSRSACRNHKTCSINHASLKHLLLLCFHETISPKHAGCLREIDMNLVF